MLYSNYQRPTTTLCPLPSIQGKREVVYGARLRVWKGLKWGNSGRRRCRRKGKARGGEERRRLPGVWESIVRLLDCIMA